MARERGDTSPADTVERQLRAGLELLRHGDYFGAHEELELAWRAADAAERDFCQGLVHVAVAWYQASRANAVGCGRQLAKAERRLVAYAPSHRGVDVDRILAQVREATRVVSAGSLDLRPLRLGTQPVTPG